MPAVHRELSTFCGVTVDPVDPLGRRFSLGEDAYDCIEWVAVQPWCDGNVGMVGISYLGSMRCWLRLSGRGT